MTKEQQDARDKLISAWAEKRTGKTDVISDLDLREWKPDLNAYFGRFDPHHTFAQQGNPYSVQ